MTYDTQESSAHGAKPVELLRVEYGTQVWDRTSADTDIVLPGIGRFQRESLVVGDLAHNQEDGSGDLDFEVPRSNPAALLFQSGLPAGVVRAKLWVAHRDNLDQAVVWWVGRIARADLHGSIARLAGVSSVHSLRRASSGMVIARQCPLLLYSAQCGADQSAFTSSVTLSDVVGRVLSGAGFSGHGDGYFNGGRLYAPDREPVLMLSSTGSTVTLARAIPGLAAGTVVRASAGCDRTHSTCLNKFNNIIHFMGFHALPEKNPYSERVF